LLPLLSSPASVRIEVSYITGLEQENGSKFSMLHVYPEIPDGPEPSNVKVIELEVVAEPLWMLAPVTLSIAEIITVSSVVGS
jgi:hypothetical protein